MISSNTKKTILLTGGLGFIGSHICLHLLDQKYKVVIIDDLSNTKIQKLDFLKNYINDHNIDKNSLTFFKNNIFELDTLEYIFTSFKFDVVIHLAAFKSVSESIKFPLNYYYNNISGTIELLKIMEKHNCFNFIFSSSATVYGNSKPPYFEDYSHTGNGITNPYGQTKYMQEIILKDLCKSNKKWNIVCLRYFNPVSQAYKELEEDPNGIPNNLFPYVLKVYRGELEKLTIFGNDYETKDGTCIRDFIHVDDLGNAHAYVCKYLTDNGIIKMETGYELKGFNVFNVGTGNGVSVKELIDTFEKVNGVKINYSYGPKRDGDLPISTANVDKIYTLLEWKTKHTLEDMVKLIN